MAYYAEHARMQESIGNTSPRDQYARHERFKEQQQQGAIYALDSVSEKIRRFREKGNAYMHGNHATVHELHVLTGHGKKGSELETVEEKAAYAAKLHHEAEHVDKLRDMARQRKLNNVRISEMKAKAKFLKGVNLQDEEREIQAREAIIAQELIVARRLGKIASEKKKKMHDRMMTKKMRNDDIRKRRLKEAQDTAHAVRAELDHHWESVHQSLENTDRSSDFVTTEDLTVKQWRMYGRLVKKSSPGANISAPLHNPLDRLMEKPHHQALWKAGVNSSISGDVTERESRRSKQATKVVQSVGETPTCMGHVAVGKGLGLELLARVNQPGAFRVPTAETDGLDLHVSTDLIEELKLKNVVARREQVPLWKRGKYWDDHVTSLHDTPIDALLAKKREIEERRRWLRKNLKEGDEKAKAAAASQNKAKKNTRYIPKSMASLHAIQLGTPEIKRREYDQRRAFLRSNLSKQDRLKLAEKMRNR
jgi:hypothetical protein